MTCKRARSAGGFSVKTVYLHGAGHVSGFRGNGFSPTGTVFYINIYPTTERLRRQQVVAVPARAGGVKAGAGAGAGAAGPGEWRLGAGRMAGVVRPGGVAMSTFRPPG